MDKIVIERRKNQDSPDPYLLYFLENWFPDKVDEFVIDGQHNEDDLEDYISPLLTIKHKVRSRICLNGFNIKSKDFRNIMSAFWYCKYIGFRASNWEHCGKNFLISNDAKFKIEKLVLDFSQDLTPRIFNEMIDSLLKNHHFKDNIKRVIITNMKFKKYPTEEMEKYDKNPWFELIKD